MNLIFFRTNI